MTVNIRFIGPVAMRARKRGSIEIPDGMDLHHLKTELGLPANYPVLFSINGVLADSETVLHEGDQVQIINIVSGG